MVHLLQMNHASMVCASARRLPSRTLAAAGRQKMSVAWLGFRRTGGHGLVAIEREGAGSAGSASTYQTLPRLPGCMYCLLVNTLPTLTILPTLQQIAAPVVC